MTAPTATELTEPQSPEHASDVLLRHYQKIGISAVVATIAAFVLLGLAVGHLLGGPDAHDRAVLALATATRHPGIALAIGATNFPEQKAVLPAILLYVVLGAILTLPYVMWRKRATDAPIA